MEISSTSALVVLVVLLFLLVRWRRKAYNLPPGPPALPLVGNILTMDSRAPFKTFLKWSKTYGPVMTTYLGAQRTVVLVGYETVKEALVDNADNFVGRAPVPFIQRVLKGYGLTISNGERWRQLRRFTLTTLRDFGMGRKRMEGWIQEESKHLLDTFRETKSAPFDPTFYLSRTVSNVICALVFGQRFSYDDNNFLHLLQVISGVLRFGSSSWGQLYNIFPWLIDLLPGKHVNIFKDLEALRVFAMSKVEKHKENLDPDSPRDFIDCFLIRLNQEKGISNSEFHYENMIATVQNLFLAGTETTSTTIRYALMLLIRHPEIQERMQKEIDTVIGQERSPTMDDRKSLPFTDAVIHEVQRYVDLVPLNLPHYALRDITFRGYTIPKDTVILPMLHSVLRDEAHWDSPWTFNPNHFLDTNGNFKKNPAFLPFSAGKRSCVGESLARMELFIFLVSLLQHFTFSCPGGPASMDTSPEVSGFANLPRKYHLIATPR
ncbi:cytochrome P450 2G1-like [Pygocentrus nattereri]|uniref:cytochrome P450 2G1-like n=1 Tax=Pygocentrus nattereri TaxID=42514 RepID=UPI000814467A|nr:cytochrome P450 2G1-like [Pygocentrus nattereri]